MDGPKSPEARRGGRVVIALVFAPMALIAIVWAATVLVTLTFRPIPTASRDFGTTVMAILMMAGFASYVTALVIGPFLTGAARLSPRWALRPLALGLGVTAGVGVYRLLSADPLAAASVLPRRFVLEASAAFGEAFGVLAGFGAFALTALVIAALFVILVREPRRMRWAD